MTAASKTKRKKEIETTFDQRSEALDKLAERAKVDAAVKKTKGNSFYEGCLIYFRIGLLGILWVFFASFVLALFLSGTTQGLLPQNSGTAALQNLFVQVVENANNLALIFLGFFFRDYLLRVER